MTRNCMILLIASALLDVACVMFVLLLFNRVDKYLTEPPAPVLLAIEEVKKDVETVSAHVQTLTFDVRDLQGNLRDIQFDGMQKQLNSMSENIRKLREASVGLPEQPEEP